jgi:hypothetical protein
VSLACSFGRTVLVWQVVGGVTLECVGVVRHKAMSEQVVQRESLNRHLWS